MEKLDLVGQAKMLEEYIEKLEANDALNYAKELEERIIRAIEELEEVKRLYDDNYTKHRQSKRYYKNIKRRRIMNDEMKLQLEVLESVTEERNKIFMYAKDLEERLLKSIEYIEKNTRKVKSTFYGLPDCEAFDGNIKDILKILKGEE